METAFHRRVIAGYADGTFRPFNNVTRGQLARIVVTGRRWDLADPRTPTFVDVPPDNPFFHYVETAVRRGIVGGYSVPGTPWREFRWGNNATRGQVARVVYQTALAPPPTAQAAIPTATK